MSGRNPIEALARLRHEFGEHGGVNMSIEASSTFTVMEPGTMPAMFQGLKGHDAGCYLYGRHFNPTVYHLGLQLAAIEGTEAAYCTASGMGAISATLLALCKSGDHIVASNAVYGGSYALMHDFLPKRAGITVTFVDITDLEAVRNAITDRTRVVYTESMSNPTLRIADIPKLSSMAREAGIPLVVDNTFSPLILSPVDHGADIVVHSITKFISGMSDVIAGAVCGTKEFIESLMDLHEGSLMLLGPTMDPKPRRPWCARLLPGTRWSSGSRPARRTAVPGLRLRWRDDHRHGRGGGSQCADVEAPEQVRLRIHGREPGLLRYADVLFGIQYVERDERREQGGCGHQPGARAYVGGLYRHAGTTLAAAARCAA
jgi:hypothetical protein